MANTRMVRINEAAAKTGLSTEAVRAIVRRHNIPTERVNSRHVLVSLDALLAHLRARHTER
jgi:excisionase family DNA binding protein